MPSRPARTANLGFDTPRQRVLPRECCYRDTGSPASLTRAQTTFGAHASKTRERNGY